MRPLNRTDLATLMAERPGPCVSIYMATDRSYPGNKQGPIRYANAVRTAEEDLGRNYPGRDVRTIRERFHALIDDQYFWTHRFDGLAVFGAPNLFEVFDLHRKPVDATVVAETFHVKPVLRETQSADRFQVLCLQREKVWLLSGNDSWICALCSLGATFFSPSAPEMNFTSSIFAGLEIEIR